MSPWASPGLGTSTALMCRASEDGFGRFLVKTLEDAGVDTSLVRRSRRTRTPLAFVSLAEDAEREFLFYGDPSAGFCSRRRRFQRHRQGEAGSFRLDRPDPRTILRRDAGRGGRRQGPRTACVVRRQPAAGPLADADAAREAIIEGIERATIVKLSDDELEFLTGSRDPSANARRLFHPGLTLMVVTHGRHGCTFVTPETAARSPASPSFPSTPPEPATPSWLAF